MRTPEEVEQYFLGFIAFIDCTEQKIPRPAVDKDKRKMYYSLGKKNTVSGTSLWLTIIVISFTKQPIRKEKT